MVWRPSGETRFMGWTVNTSRRRDRLRHRPHLENLDDRCLLSTGLDSHLAEVAVALRERPAGMIVGRPRHEGMQGKGAKHVVRHHSHTAALRERPAGTMTSSASGGLRLRHRRQPGAGELQRQRLGDDGGRDRHRRRLQQPGPRRPDSARVRRSSPATTSRTTRPIPMATTSQHGTGVAGLIGSTNPQDPGVAPGVNIVALKVTDGTNTASLDSIAKALQWVVNNHAQYNITVVNLSLSDGQNYAQNWFATTGGPAEQVTNLIEQLRGMNIPVAVATGNNFTGAQGEGFAAIVQGTISVTATDLSGHLLPDAQRLGSSIGGASATVIAAPGEDMQAPYGDNGTASVDGTSFADPAGQRLDRPAPADLRAAVRHPADRRSDPAVAPARLRPHLRPGHRDHDRPARHPQGRRADPDGLRAARDVPEPTTSIQVSTASVVPTPSSTPATQTVTVPRTTPTPPAAPATPPAAPQLRRRRPRRRRLSRAFDTTPTSSLQPRCASDPTDPQRVPGQLERVPDASQPVSGLVQALSEHEGLVGLVGRTELSDVPDRPALSRPRWRPSHRGRGAFRSGGPGVGAAGAALNLAVALAPSWTGILQFGRAMPGAASATWRGGTGFRGWTLAPGGESLGLDLENGAGHGGGERDRPEHHRGPGGPGAARRPGRPRPREARTRPRGPGAAAGTRPSSPPATSATGSPSRRSSTRSSTAFGGIDVLVCNAGTNVKNRSLESLEPADWDRMIATNLTGSFNLVHAVLPSMRPQKNGLVIQICSISGMRASTLGGAGYSASKFGQAALGICLGREEGPHGIRSTVIYPGEVETPILDARPVPVGPERREVILQPEDVAAAVRFLVELHPRAHVPELVIKPTVDDWC